MNFDDGLVDKVRVVGDTDGWKIERGVKKEVDKAGNEKRWEKEEKDYASFSWKRGRCEILNSIAPLCFIFHNICSVDK